MNITITTSINESIKKIWEFYTNPEIIKQWNHASEDWHSPSATNDLKIGGKFSYRMEAKDGSAGFDFSGIFDEIEEQKLISFTIDDGRKVKVLFENKGENIKMTTTFEAEEENPIEMQKQGWQAIQENFKKFCEGN